MAELEVYARLRYAGACQDGWLLESQPDSLSLTLSEAVRGWLSGGKRASRDMGCDTLVLRADDMYTEAGK